MPDARESSAERLVATLIAVPFGIGAALVDEIPSTIDRARRHVALARFIGRITVEQAVQELQRRVAPTPAIPVRPDAPEGEPHRAPDSADLELADGDVTRAVSEPVAEDVLALPDYDQLPAAHIVGKLAGLTTDERDDIEAYEAAHRHRRTVLGKLDQLRSGGGS